VIGTNGFPIFVLLLLALTLLGGCASQGADSIDPWEPFNRRMHTFNDALDRAILKPVAQGYTVITPDPVEKRIHNFFLNLGYPTVFVNQFLQGKPVAGMRDTAHFLVNTTLGIGGLFNVAGRLGLERHEEDFGQTFAVWGVGQGPFIVAPFFGPTTVRDGVGSAAGIFTSPTYYIDSDAARWSLRGVGLIDSRAALLESEQLISGDRYLFIRDAYLQRRQYLMNDGEIEDDPFLDEEFE